MKVTTKQIFSLTDGRVSTNMDDVSSMLSEAIGHNLFTHELPSAYEYVKKQNPVWFYDASRQLEYIKSKVGNGFETLMDYIDKNYSDHIFEITKC